MLKLTWRNNLIKKLMSRLHNTSNSKHNNIHIAPSVVVSNSNLDGNITIKRGCKLQQCSTTSETNLQLSENCQLSNCHFAGIVTIDSQSSIKDTKFIGDIHLGKNSFVNGTEFNGTIKIDEGLRILGTNISIKGKIKIGKFSSLNGPNLDLISKINGIKIGSFCSIARNVSFQEYNHKIDRVSTYHIMQNLFNESQLNDIESKGDIVIENDVWIGTQCVILGGSYVSNGAIIAANSVVTGYIPPYAIAGGNPAKIIKYRFDTAIIAALLDSQWWTLPIEEIQKNKSLFSKKLSIEDIPLLKLIGTNKNH